MISLATSTSGQLDLFAGMHGPAVEIILRTDTTGVSPCKVRRTCPITVAGLSPCPTDDLDTLVVDGIRDAIILLN
jgi:hypothetical protein